jgi:hypothetical protein
MPLTPGETAKVHEHLGYPMIGRQPGYNIGLLTSAPVHNMIAVSVEAIRAEAEPLVRRQLETLDCIKKQIADARVGLPMQQASDVRTDYVTALAMLRGEYQREQGTLAQMLSVQVYPDINSVGGVTEPCW